MSHMSTWSELLTSALPFDAKLASSTTVAASKRAVGSARMSAAALAASKWRETLRRSTRGAGGAKPCTIIAPRSRLLGLDSILPSAVVRSVDALRRVGLDCCKLRAIREG